MPHTVGVAEHKVRVVMRGSPGEQVGFRVSHCTLSSVSANRVSVGVKRNLNAPTGPLRCLARMAFTRYGLLLILESCWLSSTWMKATTSLFSSMPPDSLRCDNCGTTFSAER